MDALLPPSTRIADVHLTVRDLERSVAFYTRALGLRVHAREGRSATLGASAAFLRLHADPEARPRPPRTSGLFHVAYLLPSRADLARFLRNAAESRVVLHGASDHLVSEAIYLADPDGIGIEIYADRPREAWTWSDGRVGMATEALDVDDLLAADEGGAWAGAPEGMRVGHVHLNVADAAAAEAFYRGLGLDVTAHYPGAAFLSAGGYHHHVAVNEWNGRGAPPAPPGSVGLRSFAFEVPERAAAEALRARLGLAGEDSVARDPAGNAFRIVG